MLLTTTILLSFQNSCLLLLHVHSINNKQHTSKAKKLSKIASFCLCGGWQKNEVLSTIMIMFFALSEKTGLFIVHD